MSASPRASPSSTLHCRRRSKRAWRKSRSRATSCCECLRAGPTSCSSGSLMSAHPTLASIDARLKLAALPEAHAMTELRRMRQVEMARIAWRDLAGSADLDATLREVSLLAERLIRSRARVRHRQPRAALGQPARRSGQRRYRCSCSAWASSAAASSTSRPTSISCSSIPTVRRGGADGTTSRSSPRPTTCDVAQLLIKLLDQRTEDGFAYRVDTRLRPFGASGPLECQPVVVRVVSRAARPRLGALRVRQSALLDGRVRSSRRLRSDPDAVRLSPLPRLRRVRCAAADETTRSAQEVARKDMADNIKLGPGGIREIEFIVQAFQIVRGGRAPGVAYALAAARCCRCSPATGSCPSSTVAALAARVPLSAHASRIASRRSTIAQTHELPTDAEARARLAYSLGEPSWASLRASGSRRTAPQSRRSSSASRGTRTGARAARWRLRVATAWAPGDRRGGAGRHAARGRRRQSRRARAICATAASISAWTRSAGSGSRPSSVRTLAAIARHSPPRASRSSACCRVSRRLPPQRVPRAAEREPGRARAVARSSSCDSSWLARQIAEHPMLLDELLDNRVVRYAADARRAGDAVRARRRKACRTATSKRMLDAIRVFQRTAIFRIAVADRLGSLPLMKVSDRLTDTAELVLDFSLRTARRELVAKHGTPRCGPPLREAGFAVIGYGKLAGSSSATASDLDLVFLHDSSGAQQETDGVPPLDNERFFSRLVQRLIHFLSIQTSSGRLYEVDTRLRPSGRSGLARDEPRRVLAIIKRTTRGCGSTRRCCGAARSLGSRGRMPRVRGDSPRRARRARRIAPTLKSRGGQDAPPHAHRAVARQGGPVRPQAGPRRHRGHRVPRRLLGAGALGRLPGARRVSGQHSPARGARARRARAGGALREAQGVAYLALRQRVHELALDEGGRVVGDDEFAASPRPRQRRFGTRYSPTSKANTAPRV